MQNVQNMQTWRGFHYLLWPFKLYSSSTETKGTHVLFHPGIGLGFNREQQKQFAEPDITHSELKSALGDSRRVDEHPVLAVGLL
jgi:hypothetical protein